MSGIGPRLRHGARRRILHARGCDCANDGARNGHAYVTQTADLHSSLLDRGEVHYERAAHGAADRRLSLRRR